MIFPLIKIIINIYLSYIASLLWWRVEYLVETLVVKRICLTFFSIVYKDKNTPSPFIDQAPNDDGSLAKYGKPDHIYLDCMQAGMGCACLQVWERVFLYVIGMSTGMEMSRMV